jgi:tetratricopeptide (TPR) repeat protein
MSAFMAGSLSVSNAWATKIEPQPLPHAGERDDKDFSGAYESAPVASRFRRRPDAREVDAQKKADDEKAAKEAELAKQKALPEQKQAYLQRQDDYKKQLQQAIDANNQAVQFGKMGRWADAIQSHEKAVQLDPSNKQFRINLSAARCAFGKQRLAAGDTSGATYLFRKSLVAAPDNGLAAKSLLEALKKSGVNPNSADARLGLGDQLIAAGDLEGAAIEYQAANQLEESARTFVKMGDLSMRYGQVDGAAQWYKQALTKDAEYGPAHRQLGLIALSRKDMTDAAASLRRAVIADPKDAIAGATLVEIWRKQVAANPNVSENHLGLAGSLQLTGDFVGAESEYRKLEAMDPRNPGLEAGKASLNRAYQHAKAEKHKLAADTLFNQGLKREALAEIGQAVMLEPRNASYQFLMAECMESNGDYQGAHQAYLTCVLIDPENNKEAAARMKQMQSQSSGMTQSAPPINNYHLPVSVASAPVNDAPQSAYNPPAAAGNQYANAPQASAPRAVQKDMYEGQSASANINQANNFGNGLRTHDETSQNVGGYPSSPQTQVATQQKTINPAALIKVVDAENSKDYTGAANMIREMMSNDLSNSELHHRLAVNLMSSGDIAEAISEFRIASALTPQNKDFSEDLGRALRIHKRSMMSSNPDDGTTGATK